MDGPERRRNQMLLPPLGNRWLPGKQSAEILKSNLVGKQR
jgi:hypothetical protein